MPALICRAPELVTYAGPVLVSLFSVRIGRSGGSDYDSAVERYLRRLQAPWRAEGQVFRTEVALLDAVAAARKGGQVALWLLDSRGKSLTSEQIAGAVQRVREGGCRHLIAAVGPPDGWSADALGSVGSMGMVLSLGAVTLPHELARLVLAEQVYRATTILSGHPYHLGHD